MALFAPSGSCSANASRRGSLYGTLSLKQGTSQSRLSTYSRNSLDLLAVSGKLAYAKFELEEVKEKEDDYMCMRCLKRLWHRLTTRVGKDYGIVESDFMHNSGNRVSIWNKGTVLMRMFTDII